MNKLVPTLNECIVMRMDINDAMFDLGDDTMEATLAAIRQGLADVESGRTQNAEEFFDELASTYES